MKIAVVIVVVVVAAGAVLLLGGSKFGVSSAHPLGTMEKLAAFATELELRIGEEPDRKHVVRFFGAEIADRPGATFAQYWDRVPGFPHSVVIARDSDGKVIALAGQFRSQMFEYTPRPTNRTAMFIAQVWGDVIGDPPVFATKWFGTGAEQEYFLAEVRKGPVKATWEKNWGGGIKIAANVTDLVVLRLE